MCLIIHIKHKLSIFRMSIKFDWKKSDCFFTGRRSHSWWESDISAEIDNWNLCVWWIWWNLVIRHAWPNTFFMNLQVEHCKSTFPYPAFPPWIRLYSKTNNKKTNYKNPINIQNTHQHKNPINIKNTRQISSDMFAKSAIQMTQISTPIPLDISYSMMTSSNGNLFRVSGPLWGQSTGHRWISFTNASDAELWCFLWSAPEQTIGTQVIWDAIANQVGSVH